MLAFLVNNAAAAIVTPASRPAVQSRVAGPTMAASKKIISMEGFPTNSDELFEVREINYKRPPVKILSRLNEMQVATSVADAGLLSAAEEAGVFSTLDSVGAFSLIEKSPPPREIQGP